MLTYTSRATGPLRPQELDVSVALSAYTSLGATDDDRVPMSTLYQTYRDWWLRERGHWRHEPPFPERYQPLTRRQFGATLVRCFPMIKKERAYQGGRRYTVYARMKLA